MMTTLEAAQRALKHREIADAYLAMGDKVNALLHYDMALWFLQECPISDAEPTATTPEPAHA